jgi:hypothetical protein
MRQEGGVAQSPEVPEGVTAVTSAESTGNFITTGADLPPLA